jgi:glutathionyl-hydroquinone reductase
MTQTPLHPSDLSADPQYASPVDTERFGEYRITQRPDDPRPLYRFTGRLIAPGPDAAETPGRYVAEPGRFHLYSGWFCPWAQRSTLVIALAGLEDVVSVSYVDGVRDARGWAFRETNGPDPVNGFTLLRQAYDATEPGFDGHVSVPTLWDRRRQQVASNDYGTLDADLASQFQQWSSTGVELYPADLRTEIDELERWLLPTVNHGVRRAAGEGEAADAARAGVQAAFATLERSLANSRYLLGDRLTLADVRLFVTLARYDRQANATGRVGPHLPELPNLWAYARDLYQQDGFRATTRFETYSTGPGPVVAGLDWDEPADREARAS